MLFFGIIKDGKNIDAINNIILIIKIYIFRMKINKKKKTKTKSDFFLQLLNFIKNKQLFQEKN